MTPRGADKGRLAATDLVRCRLGGASSRRASTEALAHLAVYRACPGVQALVHAHPPARAGARRARAAPGSERARGGAGARAAHRAGRRRRPGQSRAGGRRAPARSCARPPRSWPATACSAPATTSGRRWSGSRCWSCSPASRSRPPTGRWRYERHAPVRRRRRLRARHAARRADAAALPRRGRGAGDAGRGRGRAAPACRARRAALPRLLGTARQRQDDAGARARRGVRRRVRDLLGRALGRQGGARRDGVGAAPARRHRPPHRALRRRGAPLQQVAAGRLPPVRRERRHRADRRHHREPVVRAQRRAALAGQGLRPRAARRRPTSALLARARPGGRRAGASAGAA